MRRDSGARTSWLLGTKMLKSIWVGCSHRDSPHPCRGALMLLRVPGVRPSAAADAASPPAMTLSAASRRVTAALAPAVKTAGWSHAVASRPSLPCTPTSEQPYTFGIRALIKSGTALRSERFCHQLEQRATAKRWRLPGPCSTTETVAME
jgi:hypothetical protein